VEMPIPTESDLELANRVASGDLPFPLNGRVFSKFANAGIFTKWLDIWGFRQL